MAKDDDIIDLYSKCLGIVFHFTDGWFGIKS